MNSIQTEHTLKYTFLYERKQKKWKCKLKFRKSLVLSSPRENLHVV